MAASYTVVQYVPNPTTDERINVGVLVFGGGRVCSHFIENWNRVRHFGSADINFLKDFGRDVNRLDEPSVQQMINRWNHSIQFTSPVWAELGHDELLLEVAQEFLVDPPQPFANRTRSTVVRTTTSVLKVAIKKRLGGTGGLFVKNKKAIVGAHGPHTFDIYVGNGHPVAAIQGLSFAASEETAERDYEAIAWTIKDTKDKLVGPLEPSMTVVYVPPERHVPFYDQATSTLKALGADLVPDSNVAEWANRIADLVDGPTKDNNRRDDS